VGEGAFIDLLALGKDPFQFLVDFIAFLFTGKPEMRMEPALLQARALIAFLGAHHLFPQNIVAALGIEEFEIVKILPEIGFTEL
jgi:hypothetical protein